MFIPYGDRVLVRLPPPERVTAGGIHIPDTHTEAPQEGVVITCGPDVVEVKPGDKVLFRRHAGIAVGIDKHGKVEGPDELNDDTAERILEEPEILAVRVDETATPPDDVVAWVNGAR